MRGPQGEGTAVGMKVCAPHAGETSRDRETLGSMVIVDRICADATVHHDTSGNVASVKIACTDS